MMYRCDKTFYLEPLQKLIADGQDEDCYGVLVVDGNGALFATIQGCCTTILQEVRRNLPTKHRKGGQSQARMARLHDETVHRYLRQVAETAAQHYLVGSTAKVKGLIVAGPTGRRNQLQQHKAWNQALSELVIQSLETAHSGRRGLAQAVQASVPLLNSQRLSKEMQVLDLFFSHVRQMTGRWCSSVRDTIQAMEAGAAAKIIVSEDFAMKRVYVTTSDGGGTGGTVKYVVPSSVPTASSANVAVQQGGEEDVLEWIFENHRNYGSQLQIVSDSTSQGTLFREGYGGIGALLRWNIDFVDSDEESTD